MMINPLTPNLIHLLSRGSGSKTTGRVSESVKEDFGSILTHAFKNVAKFDTADKTSTLELLTGTSDDFAALLIDAQKAELSLNLALQLRNKVVDSYNEMMRMQV